MFGPNPSHKIKKYERINYSHRDEYFKNLYKECKNLFINKFNLKDYDIVFITSPATVAMEIVISSLNHSIKTKGAEGKFKNRWQSMIDNRFFIKNKNKPLTLSVDFETSKSIYNESKNADIVDIVSSFPYCNLTKNNKIAITCVNKIIGSSAGISVILIRKNSGLSFKNFKNYSFLDLEMHKRYSALNQTACTASIFLFETLKQSLIDFCIEKTKKMIENNSRQLLNLVKKDYKFLPAVTISKDLISKEIAEKYCIYGYNDIKKTNYQIFTYSEKPEDYSRLIKDIKKENIC